MAETIRQRARRVFMELADLPPEAQAAAMQRTCASDEQLRAEVQALLDAEARARGFMASQTADLPGHPASDIGMTSSSAATLVGAQQEQPGTRIGPYKLLQLIGEGGFGSVFMAEQEKPVARKVALKVIKLGMDTRQVVARFEQERQALAILDHPNIAKVFDAGATETGRPYFVMELCTGEPIDAYCDRNNLSIHERLELFAQVCQAVQHAHTKGIIHRDIKPSNVLVSAQDGQPSAKVIDFGIAKATAARLTEKTVFTEHRQIIGTPEYMSPEQAEGSLDIDTRTDIYALGVMLYELLTGSTPFSSRELRSAAYAEIQRIIREVEPPKPSTRLSQNTDTIASVAARRRTEPRKLGTIIRGELDWIVMKALEKDRQRRYETANGLAMDIRRYLSGEAVVAAPPSRAYRFRKFIRRNRPQVIAAALVALALVAGLAGTAWQAKVASDRAVASRKAEAEARAARDAEKERADQLKKVSDFQAGMLGQIDTKKAGIDLMADVRERFASALEQAGVPEAEHAARVNALQQELVRVNATDTAAAMIDRTILKPAIKTIDEQFKDDPATDAGLRQALATLYQSIGLYPAAFPLQESALATRRRVMGEGHLDTLTSINNMGFLLQAQGKLDQAGPYYREALEKRRRVLGEEHPDTLGSINNMGFLLQAQGKLDQAGPYYREALEKLRRVLGEEHPDTLQSINNMGALLQSQGKLNEAEPYLLEALEKRRRVLGEEHPDTLASINNMGVLLRAQGKLDQAEPYYREALEKSRRVLGEEHPNTLVSIAWMGVLLRAQGKLDQAEPYYREALEKNRRVLGEEHPNTLAFTGNLGRLLQLQGKHQDAIELLLPVEPTARKAFTGGNAPRLGMLLTTLGRARVGVGYDAERFALAEANLLEAHAIHVDAKDRGPAHKDTLECVQGLVELYKAWHAAEPEKGYDTRAAEWQGTPDAK
ncbi:MAG: tetratricopeptide repeat protein [Phycisphaerae bacterium]|nr:tetratricopeptide repeat protein [Phycisphaerae bacterium]